MNLRKLVPAVVVTAVLLVALIAAGFAFGQEGTSGEPQNQGEGANGVQVPDAVLAEPNGRISYQGRLLQGGNPVTATLNITFRLYTVNTGGVAFWTETQSVVVKEGLFSIYLGSVTPLDNLGVNFQSQVWLGVQPAGAASELTPRQPLGAAGYAFSIMPGATMVDANPAGGYGYSLFVSTTNHSGIFSSSGTGEGITGSSSAQNHSGVNGSNTAGGATSHGVEGVGGGTGNPCPTTSNDCTSGLFGSGAGESYGTFSTSGRTAFIGRTSTNFYTGFFYSTLAPNGSGIWTNGESRFNDFVTFAGGKSGYVVDVAYNDSNEILEKGDVVMISGFAEPVVGDIPVIKLQRASGATDTGVVGVVDVHYTPCTETELPAGQACGGFDPDVTTIQPGEYLAVVTLGAYNGVKVSAVNGPIKPGDLLAVDGTQNGFAAKAQTATVDNVEFVLPGTSFGKALGGLDSGTGLIPVFVTIR